MQCQHLQGFASLQAKALPVLGLICLGQAVLAVSPLSSLESAPCRELNRSLPPLQAGPAGHSTPEVRPLGTSLLSDGALQSHTRFCG